MCSNCLEKTEIATLTTSSRRLGDQQQMFAEIYIFVKHIIFSKLVYRLKSCNFVSNGIAKKSQIKLSEILEGAILYNQWGGNL